MKKVKHIIMDIIVNEKIYSIATTSIFFYVEDIALYIFSILLTVYFPKHFQKILYNAESA
jgi:hypothetical protein